MKAMTESLQRAALQQTITTDNCNRQLQQTIDAVAQLPPGEQDKLANCLLTELDSERQWSEVLAGAQDALASMAKEALEEHARGETEDLDLK
jgi:hypothetical protein